MRADCVACREREYGRILGSAVVLGVATGAISFFSRIVAFLFLSAPTDGTTGGKPSHRGLTASRSHSSCFSSRLYLWFGGIWEARLSEERLPSVSSGCS